MVGISGPAQANLVTNGSFETTTLSSPGGYICAAGSSCTSRVTGWSSTCNAGGCGNGATVAALLFSGTNGSAFNGGIGLGGTVSSSPDGGNFIAIDGDPTYRASLSQTINGLTVGTSYQLTFYQAGGQQRGASGATTDDWIVSFGADQQTSTPIHAPAQTFSAWSQQTMIFVATSTSEVLSFLANGTPSGEPPVSFLDGVSLTAVATPEPASLALLGAGLVGVTFLRRQRRAG
jgi:hypothetical protein